MKKIAFLATGIALLLFFASCASYIASPLNNLSSEMGISQPSENNVFVGAKAFNRADCKRYLDRDVIAEGYQPVQLYIQNNSDKEYLFAIDRVGLSLAGAEEVADRVHTSTVGRAAGYGIGALFLWPLIIPAIVDGVKSANANEALGFGFSAKTARNQVIVRHSNFNKLLFIPKSLYQPFFTITLIDHATNQPKIMNVFVRG